MGRWWLKYCQTQWNWKTLHTLIKLKSIILSLNPIEICLSFLFKILHYCCQAYHVRCIFSRQKLHSILGILLFYIYLIYVTINRENLSFWYWKQSKCAFHSSLRYYILVARHITCVAFISRQKSHYILRMYLSISIWCMLHTINCTSQYIAPFVLFFDLSSIGLIRSSCGWSLTTFCYLYQW